VPSGAATQQDLDKALADVGEAIAAIQSAEATIQRADLDLKFSKITAPIGGQISRALITKGNLIRVDGDLLTTIASLDPIYVYFNVDERTLLQLRQRARSALPPGATQPDVKTLKIPVYIGLANEPGYPHEGVIDFADNKIDPTTGTIRARGTFDNAKRIFQARFLPARAFRSARRPSRCWLSIGPSRRTRTTSSCTSSTTRTWFSIAPSNWAAWKTTACAWSPTV